MKSSLFTTGALILLLCAPAMAATYPGPFAVDSLRVKDGDTAAVVVEVWPGQTQTIDLRLHGVNAAETRPAEAHKVCARGGGAGCAECELAAGEKAKKWALAWVDGKSCAAVDIQPGYQGRFDGDLVCDGVRWTDAGLAAGHLVRSADTRKPWCSP